MTSSNNSNYATTVHDGFVDPFESAFDALRSAGVGFEIVDDFGGIETDSDSFEHAA